MTMIDIVVSFKFLVMLFLFSFNYEKIVYKLLYHISELSTDYKYSDNHRIL